MELFCVLLPLLDTLLFCNALFCTTNHDIIVYFGNMLRLINKTPNLIIKLFFLLNLIT